jgi:hypothetical protein
MIAHRHLIGPVTSSILRNGITGESKQKIDSNFKNKNISKQVLSTDLKYLNSENSKLTNQSI